MGVQMRSAVERNIAEGAPDTKRRRTDAVEDKTQHVHEDTNGVPRSAGRVWHLDLANGELAERVVVVGHPSRAELLSQFLEPEPSQDTIFRKASARGFLTFTGMFAGKRMSVVSCGMGLPMMDFFVRECRAVVPAGVPMAVVRYGTCGGLQRDVEVGTVAVAAEGAVLIQRKYDAFGESGTTKSGTGYRITEVVRPDDALTRLVMEEMKGEVGDEHVRPGLNVTGDSFYGAQGRMDTNFDDANEKIIEQTTEKHPAALSMEMESYQLLHLAKSCRPAGSLRASSAAVIIANRQTGDVASGDVLKARERQGGLALLRALAKLDLQQAV